MEDRFKFRVWHNQDKKMYQVRTIMTSNATHDYKISGYVVQKDKSILRFDVPEEFDACTLMQCTGLKDKNKTLIYEGDILQYEWFTDSFAPHIWRKDIFRIEDTRKDYTKLSNISKGAKHRDVEIIGNLYQNPELLNQE